jgi:hypothetical protein
LGDRVSFERCHSDRRNENRTDRQAWMKMELPLRRTKNGAWSRTSSPLPTWMDHGGAGDRRNNGQREFGSDLTPDPAETERADRTKTNTKSTSGPITLTNPKAGPETLDSRWWFKPDR